MREPSISMLRRLAAQAPEKLVAEVDRLRQERDNLKIALTLKMAEHFKTLKMEKNEILVVRKIGNLSSEEAADVMESLAERLRARHGWEGVIVLATGDSTESAVTKLSDVEAMKVYEALKGRFAK